MVNSISRAFGGPHQYIQGPGEFNHIQELTSEYGKNAYFVIDPFLYDALLERLNGIYGGTDSAFRATAFQGESCQEEVDRIVADMKEMHADVIVCVGGGKACDTAKMVADTVDVPRILMPSSASTDAPTSGLAILYTKEGVHVVSKRMKHNSELVLMDSELIVNAPARLFSAGMGDALATYFEAKANAATETQNYIGKGYRRCRAAMAIAREAYEILLEDGENALAAVKRHLVTEEVENVIEANTLLSGLGFENTGCAAAHGIHSGISEIASSHSIMHGEKVAFSLVCQMVLENTPREEMDRIMRFLINVDLPVTLAGINVEPTEENLNLIVDHTVNKNPLIHHEPVVITEGVVKNAILAADELGQKYLKLMGK